MVKGFKMRLDRSLKINCNPSSKEKAMDDFYLFYFFSGCFTGKEGSANTLSLPPNVVLASVDHVFGGLVTVTAEKRNDYMPLMTSH